MRIGPIGRFKGIYLLGGFWHIFNDFFNYRQIWVDLGYIWTVSVAIVGRFCQILQLYT